MPRLLTVKDIAHELSLSEEEVRRKLRRGTIKGIKVGYRGWRVDPKDFEEYLNGHKGN